MDPRLWLKSGNIRGVLKHIWNYDVLFGSNKLGQVIFYSRSSLART